MRYVATVLVLVPAIFALVSDRDAFGIGFAISGGLLGIVQWAAFAILPAVAGILFIMAGKKKTAPAQSL